MAMFPINPVSQTQILAYVDRSTSQSISGSKIFVDTTSFSGTLSANGGQVTRTTIITAATSLNTAAYSVIYNSVSSLIVTLPNAVTNNGRVYNIKNKSTGVCILSAINAELIDGFASADIVANSSYTVQSDGVTWCIM